MSPTTTPENVAATFCATLVDEWLHHGIRHAVVAPGSRSTPMALALADRGEIQLHVFHDERAASFAALGIGHLGVPAILLCTSGTAAANFHPAVIEAHQSAISIIVCTADRPPELRDVGAPQTIDQTKLYGDAVRWFHDPGVPATEASGSWRSLAAHAFAASTGLWPGPVHLNLPFREPLVGTPMELPPRRATGPVAVASTPLVAESVVAALAADVRSPRGVIVAGKGCGSETAIRSLARAAGWPVLADARSGLRHVVDVCVGASDAILRSPSFADSHRPDVVLRLGEPPVSKVVNQWLSASGAVDVHITAVPVWTDAHGVITRRVVADPSQVCAALVEGFADASGRDARWLDDWTTAEAIAQATMSTELPDTALNEPSVARFITATRPAGSHLVVSSSMPIRDVEWFGIIPPGVTVHCNRGANGIDGVVATAIGVALATAAPTTLLIGDIALLHDSAALVGLGRREIDLRIVVVDNDGGGIFSFLPQARMPGGERFETLFGTPHGTNLQSLAHAHGISFAAASSVAELLTAGAKPGPSIIVVRTDRAANVAADESVHNAVVEALQSLA